MGWECVVHFDDLFHHCILFVAEIIFFTMRALIYNSKSKPKDICRVKFLNPFPPTIWLTLPPA